MSCGSGRTEEEEVAGQNESRPTKRVRVQVNGIESHLGHSCDIDLQEEIFGTSSQIELKDV